MTKPELEAFACEVAKRLKGKQNLNEFSQLLSKVTVEGALIAGLENHLIFVYHLLIFAALWDEHIRVQFYKWTILKK